MAAARLEAVKRTTLRSLCNMEPSLVQAAAYGLVVAGRSPLRSHGNMTAPAIGFKCTEQLFHLLDSILDALGRADFASAPQSGRLLHQPLSVPRRPEVNAGIFAGWRAGCSFGTCSHESSLPSFLR
jgi:hypothetical protein